MSNYEMRPPPCDRVIELLIDGEVWKTVKSCDIHIQDAIKEVKMEAERRMMTDGQTHLHAIHLKGVASARNAEVQ